MYSITEEDVKICFSEIFKIMAFSRPFLERNCLDGSISIKKHCFQEIVILKQQMRRVSWTLLFGLCLSLKIATHLK